MEYRDLIIIGAGPAGLSAGIHAVYFDLKASVFEENIPGGLAAEIPMLENYPGFSKGISGRSLIERMVEQCKRSEIEIHQFEKVVKLNLEGREKIVETDKSKYTANAVIIALGRHPRVLGVPGENEFRGKGVSYCAVCDGAFFKGKKVIVIGEKNPAAEIAVYFSNSASKVTLICLRPRIEAEKVLIERLTGEKIEVLTNMEIREIKGDVKVKSVVLSDKKIGDTKEIETDGVFFQLEEIPNSQLAEQAGIKVDEEGYIIVDEKGKTNIDNIYAVGDITNHSVKQVITAVAQATVAVNDIFEKETFKNGTG
ncbi:MAG: FAD-dependent oxidoreductase [Candidatus Omnitrophica bacterium]|nr:FAD-dependent oxidoreductase [Candidatus Omnitrophota bacterium]